MEEKPFDVHVAANDALRSRPRRLLAVSCCS